MGHKDIELMVGEEEWYRNGKYLTPERAEVYVNARKARKWLDKYCEQDKQYSRYGIPTGWKGVFDNKEESFTTGCTRWFMKNGEVTEDAIDAIKAEAPLYFNEYDLVVSEDKMYVDCKWKYFWGDEND